MARFKKRNKFKRYGLPLVLVGVVFILKTYFQQFLGDNSAFLFVSFVVAASSWYGGFGPGIFATILSAIGTYFLFLRLDAHVHPFFGDIVVEIIFLIEGMMISLVSEARFQVEDQKDEFIGFVAHELKNPLAALKGFASLITMTAKKKNDEKSSIYGEKIVNQSDKILELINELLDITNIEIGKLSYNDSAFHFRDIVKDIVFQQQIVSKNRVIELHGTSRHLLFADKYRVGQVITNLLANAIKYSPDTKKVVVSMKDTKKSIVLRIKDFGIGIHQKDQKKIFDRFYRAHDLQRARSDGLGLGLYISSQIVNHHGGKLWVKSKNGKGTTFYMELPVHRLDKQSVLSSFIL